VFIRAALRVARTGLPLTALAVAILAANAGARAQNKKDFAVAAHKYGYTVDGAGSEIHVQQDDLVRIRFSTDDIPHSFTLEDETYRIMRRAETGKPVMFEFRADKPGRFPFKCTLTADDRCKEMQGWLVVDAKK
jgi:heme/copper-type cytochrome/quinol oxidase subunit 2